MFRRILLFLLLMIAFSCRPDMPDLVTGITVGSIDTASFHVETYTPVLELSPVQNQTETILLDLNNDVTDDIEIKYQYGFENVDEGSTKWNLTTNSLITIVPLSTDYRISVKNIIDSVYFCLDETGPDFHDFEYTINSGITCEYEGNTSGIRQTIGGDYCENFDIGSFIYSGLDWNFGEVTLAKHEFQAQGDNENNLTHDNRKDIRIGLSEWAAETYLGICKVDTPRNKYGYIKVKLVELDSHMNHGFYSWKLQVLETAFQK